MDQFPDGTYMRLRSRVRRTSYLHADEDGVGISLRPLGRERPATLNAVWRVHRVLRDGIDYVLLHGAAYGRYLALSPDEEERARGHDRGVPAIQRGYDERDLDSITWNPVAVEGANTGGYVRLRHVYNGNLRANGRFRPWSTRVTVDQYFGMRSTMRHWKVEVVPPRQGPPPALPLPTGASSAVCSNVSSSRAAACDASDPKPEPEVEGSANKNTETSDTGGRYRNHEPHDCELISSSVAPIVDNPQRMLPPSAKSSAMLENIRLQEIRLQRGGQYTVSVSSEHATSESTFLKGPISTWHGVTYATTLAAGGGYGYPHPPPFYKCEVCTEKTASYRLSCCHTVVCQCCGCACESAAKENQREKLPNVKLEGSDLFLWQPFSLPDRQMLFLARRTENRLQYFFAPIQQLMDPLVDPVKASVYEFVQQGNRVISMSITEKHLTRS